MDTPFPSKQLTVDKDLLKGLKDRENLDVLSLLLSQRSRDLADVKQWALAHIDKDLARCQERYEKEESEEKKIAMDFGLRVLKQLKINIQNEQTVYKSSMF